MEIIRILAPIVLELLRWFTKRRDKRTDEQEKLLKELKEALNEKDKKAKAQRLHNVVDNVRRMRRK